MGKHKHLCRHDKLLVVVGFLLFLLRLGETTAAGYFEDADQSNDFLSSSASPDHHFDLRHTIPGEPHIDYPIYSTVPKTSFGCADRHEGYYADIETRCQAFRICTHTARSEQGFGFLCPNGTLFSQKNFVCDWYRNVNCEESEQYYSKNDANRIGSKKDMMETVRQMMEYPMKSISKALQNSQGNSKRPTYSSFNTLNMGDNSGVSTRNAQAPVTDVTNNSRKTAVTRAQVESVSKYGSDDLKESVNVAETQNPAKPFNPQTQNQDEFSIDLRSSQDAFGSNDAIPVDVYVNSLGELSTDPGVNFDKSQSHILALGQQDREKAMDFAQTINVALNNLDDLSPTTAVIAPDYVKRMRSTQEGTLTSFANNINDLQQKLAKDKERSSPHKHAIRFLSRGFAAQDEVNKKTTAPYLYTRPKQTPSTIRFTPNALSTDSLKSYSYDDSKSELHKAINTLEASSEDIIDTVAILTTTPRLQISKDKDYLREAVSSVSTDDGSYLSPPSLENPEVNDEPIRVLNEIYDSTTSDSKTKVDAQVEPERQELLTPKKDLEVDEDRISVNKQAANLLLAGVKLSLLDMSPNSYEPVTKEITSPKKPTTTTTIRRGAATRDRSTKPTSKITTTEATPTTKAHQSPTVFTSTMKTSTETVTEISSTEKRVRNFRRFATVRRASLKPDIIAKRTYVRTTPKSFRVTARTTTTPAPALTTTAATTTRTNTTPARSYQKRFGISRLRAPRMTTARSTIARTSTTTEPPLQTPATTVRNVRHSDKETATYGYNPDAGSSSSSTAVATWESVRRNLQRYEVNRKTSELNSYDFTSEAPITRSPTSQTYVTPKERSRKRNSNFKTQATEPRSKTPVITMEPKTKTTKMSTIQQVEPPNYISPFTLPTTSITHSYPNPSSSPSTTFDHNFLNSVLPSPVTSLNFGQQSSSVTDTVQLSVSPTAVSSDVLSFDKLTQSIVDNSILQNFQNSPYDSAGAASNFNGRSTPKSSANKFPLKHARSFSYEKQAAKAPSELTPPIRPNYLSQNPTIPRAQLPRVVVARAEGQRIEPNSLQSIITNLVEQPGHGAKSSQRKVPYVPLKDFLTSKFGANNNNNIQLATEPTTQKTQNRQEKPITITQQQPEQHQQQQQLQYQLNGNSIFQQQQQQLYQQPQVYQQQQPQYQQQQLLPQQQYQQQQPQYQQQSQYQQQQIHQYQQPNQQYLQQSLHTQQLQQPKILSSAYKPQVEQQEVPFGLAVLNKLQTQQQKPLQHQQQQQQHQQPQMQQPFNTQNIFTNFQQQQQQLPQFPPLQNAQPQQQQQLQQSGNFRNYVQRIDSLNVPLPTLPNGLLPSISAQRRSDDAIEQLDLSSDISARPSTYDGASSYDVPLNSIGRLPNDKTLLRQRQRQRHGRRN